MKEHLVLSEAVSRATQPASRRAVPCTSVNSRDLSRQARRLQEHPEPPVGVASLLPRGGPPISQILILQWILHGQVIAQPTCRREWPTVSCGSPSRSRTQHRGGGRGRRDACAGRPARASSRQPAPPTPRPSLPRARALRRVPARRLSERRAQRVPRRVPGTPGPALLGSPRLRSRCLPSSKRLLVSAPFMPEAHELYVGSFGRKVWLLARPPPAPPPAGPS